MMNIIKNVFILLVNTTFVLTAINSTIKKVVIPAAGLGTRFLPFTKVIPKEMLPLLNKPMIHEIIQEGVRAGLVDFLLITKKQKHALADYFDAAPELDTILSSKKRKLLSPLDALMDSITIACVRQAEQRGLGHAILMAQPWIKDEYFCVFLPDRLIFYEPDVMQKLMNILLQEQADAIFAVEQVPMEDVSRRGVVRIKRQLAERVYEIADMVEKPSLEEAPSNLVVAGRYILSPAIFDSLQTIEPGVGGEIQLTDALKDMLQRGKRVLVYEIQGKSYDTGRPLAWLETNIAYALQQPEYAQEVRDILKTYLEKAE